MTRRFAAIFLQCIDCRWLQLNYSTIAIACSRKRSHFIITCMVVINKTQECELFLSQQYQTIFSSIIFYIPLLNVYVLKIILNALSVNPLNVSVPSISAFRASRYTLNICLQCKNVKKNSNLVQTYLTVY